MKILAKEKSAPHDSSFTHVQGKSEFIDDRARQAGELVIGLVLSTEAHAEIVSIDDSSARKIPGVVGMYTGKDFAHNAWGTIFQDQPLLATNKVQYNGEVIAIIAAETKAAAAQARRAVKIKYKKLAAILSIEEAKKKKSFIGDERHIQRGDFASAYEKSVHRLEGAIRIQGQDHFYLESQACIAYPLENNCVEVYSSTQHPTEAQHVVAHALGIPDKNVSCVVKRMGGAFGGKESQSSPFAAYAALVAMKHKRPARLILTKDDDMIITGKRNPFCNEYRVGFDDHGEITALEVKFFSDGGAYADLSTAIMERAMLHMDNAYYLPVVKITGQVCKTHNHPHTAFRGFGGPKGVATIENILEDIARQLGKDALDVRKKNMYRPGRDIAPYGQKITNNLIPELFSQLEQSSGYRKRRQEIELFNQRSKSHLKGLSLTAVKFGISFTTRFLNQGNALVNVQMDGSVQVSTGATEMGQGVNTKIAQTVAKCFGLSVQQVRVLATSTERNHNTSPTAASSGSDINAKAALIAAEKIKSRMAQVAHFMLTNPENKWATPANASMGTAAEFELQDQFDTDTVIFSEGFAFLTADKSKKIPFARLCRETFLHRISLGEYGFFKIPKIHFNKLTGTGEPFFYFTQGTACSEVLIDRFTGEIKVTRTDILMDLGRPINQGIDIGQVTGGFVQGMGWVTTENLHYNENGLLLSHSPSTYKIPNVQDTPRIFNINLLENLHNDKNIGGSKAVGEPPLLLSLSVWCAIKDALSYICKNNEIVSLPIPATLEKVILKIDELERGKS